MSLLKIVVETPESAQTVKDNIRISTGAVAEGIQRLGNFLQGLIVKNGSIKVNTGGVKASCAFTFTGAPVAAETCTVNGVTFTARASGAVANEFNIGGTVTITAANLAAAINTSVSAGIVGIVTATSSLGVCTVSAVIPGVAGNYLIAPTEALTNATVAGWTGGTEDATVTLAVGL
jgi:hypothetical protein